MAAKKTVRTKKKVPNARVSGHKPKQKSSRGDKQRWVEGIAMILIGVYCYYAFVTAQPSIIDRIVGKYLLMYLFGNAVPVLCLILIASGILMMLDKLDDYKETLVYVILLAVNFMVFLSIFIPNLNVHYKVIDLFDLAKYGGYGGIVGTFLAYLLNAILTRQGTVIALAVLSLVEFFMLFKINFPNIYGRMKASDFGLLVLKNKYLDLSDELAQRRAIQRKNKRRAIKQKDAEELYITDKDLVDYSVEDSLGSAEEEDPPEDPPSEREPEGPRKSFDTDLFSYFSSGSSKKGKTKGDGGKTERADAFDVDPQPLRSRIPAEEMEIVSEDDMVQLDFGDRLERTDSSDYIAETLNSLYPENQTRRERVADSKYKLPSLELLTKPSGKSNIDEREIKENASKIKETLNNFGVDATIRSFERGPSITRYEVKPAPGVKVSKIVNLADDLALALAASDIRIEAPIPGKDAIGIEVPNKKSDIVHLREIVASEEFQKTKCSLPFSVGKTLSGNSVVGDISGMPHLLIAGSTGSGKSVCINSIIISLLYSETPDDLKMIMIDPKMVELSQYNAIPHLMVPVVTDPDEAAGALNWGIKEMEERYNLFSETGVRDLESYNELMGKNNEDKLPRIVIIIDELADLMMTSPKEVESAICRIAQKARACGIHLVIATQRPSVDVITGLIKSNIPSRIAFAVASNNDSRTILDTAGAEKLLGKGDMLYKPVGLSKPLRIQCPFVSDAEIARVIEAVKLDEEPEYNEDISDTITQHAEQKQEKEKKGSSKRDSLYDEAVEVAFVNEQVSTSMLQRRLGIGYARAGRIIDSLEKDGIISGPNGSKPRKLLITESQYRGQQA